MTDAYRSWVEIRPGPAPPGPPEAELHPCDPRLIALRSALDSVVTSLFRPDERYTTCFVEQQGWLLLRVESAGEIGRFWIGAPADLDEMPFDQVIDQVASSLEDWMCKTSFAWGEQRIARR